MDFVMILYILLCVVIGGGIVSNFYNDNQKVAGITALVLLILIFTFFGLRWFKDGSVKGSQQGTVTWPPIVNMCPDFMVTWTNTDGKIYCYDASNIYGLKTSTCCGLSSKNLKINGLDGQSAFLIKDPSQNTGATNLNNDTNGLRWPLLGKFKTAPQVVVTDAASSLKWEGVWDGRSSTPTAAPLP
jgi:hypothetical protein